MQEKYRYNAFGLNIRSEVLISGFLPGEGTYDIDIILGKVPSKIDSAILDQGENYKISKSEFWFYIEDVAHYYIRDGSLIVVEPFDTADSDTVRVYLVSTALGVAMLQRGMLMLHGSCVVVNGRSIIFTGGCGAGKSTICSAMQGKGYQYLADDISVIALNEGGIPIVQPAFPQQRLFTDTAKVMGYDPNDITRACKDDDKLLVNASRFFKKESIPLTAVVELLPKNECEVNISKIVGTEKLNNFIQNIYCSDLLARTGVEVDLFRTSLNVVKKISYYILERPIGKFTLEEQIRLVRECIGA